MKYNLSHSMHIDDSKVSIKATTSDHLGFVGDSSGWAVQAIATLCIENEPSCT